ncbi:hypothetical protein K2X33_06155 [bacterium]|nr:hypothetical protein [bacterium]
MKIRNLMFAALLSFGATSFADHHECSCGKECAAECEKHHKDGTKCDCKECDCAKTGAECKHGECKEHKGTKEKKAK